MVSGRYLAVSGNIWRDLAIAGGIWEIYGGIGQNLQHLAIWRYLRHLAVSGGATGSKDMQQRAATCAGMPSKDNALPVHLSDIFNRTPCVWQVLR